MEKEYIPLSRVYIKPKVPEIYISRKETIRKNRRRAPIPCYSLLATCLKHVCRAKFTRKWNAVIRTTTLGSSTLAVGLSIVQELIRQSKHTMHELAHLLCVRNVNPALVRRRSFTVQMAVNSSIVTNHAADRHRCNACSWCCR